MSSKAEVHAMALMALESQGEQPWCVDEEDGTHPALMNDLVLENVFRHLDKPEDIFACMQVCMKWRKVVDNIKQDILYPKILASIIVTRCTGLTFEESINTVQNMRQVSRQWKKDTDLRIANFSDLKRDWIGKTMFFFQELLGFSPITLGNGNIDRFLKEMGHRLDNPFVGRQLKVVWSDPSMKASLLKLLKQIGSHVLNFILIGKNFSTFPDYLLMREILANLPNLQILSLQCECASCCAQEFYKNQWNDEMFNCLVEQHPLQKLPNLQSYFGYLDWGVDARLVKIIIQMHKQQLTSVTSRNWNFPLTVPTFDINAEFPKLLELQQVAEGFSHDCASVEVLRRCNLPLSELRITLKDPSQFADLKNLGSTLKLLTISFVGGNKKGGRSRKPLVEENIGKHFPRLKSLAFFFEKGSYKGSFDKYKKRFTSNFVKSFPSLQKMELYDGGYGQGCYFAIRLK